MRSSGTLWPDVSTPSEEQLAEGITLLRGFCRDEAQGLLDAIGEVAATSPFRQMIVPGGHTISVAMTNAGTLGWTTDRTGYRYTTRDPVTGSAWPAIPETMLSLAVRAAAAGGFPGFATNACLINRYATGARLSLHQDKNERDYSHPIVSVSLGLPATFLLGTMRRTDTPRRVRIEHGDILVWGGPARLVYHGVAPIRQSAHPLTGAFRFNLTFRRAVL
ncbi:MAG: DNA oxidative demethylase AlkB [Acidobacteria bacterium]|nr:DNA oxidative demethylase AlkB [Acidobacteriota bacterium]